MTFEDTCASVLAQLGGRLGIDGLKFDPATGSCALAFDNRITVYIAPERSTRALMLFSVLGEIDVPRRTDLLVTLLRGNYMWRASAGATLSLDSQQDVVVAARLVHEDGISCDLLEARLTAFVSMALSWWDRLRCAAVPLASDADHPTISPAP